MDISQIQQVVDSIKTLNLNLNASTTEKLADLVLPIYQMKLHYNYVRMGIIAGIFLVIIVGLCVGLRRADN